MLTATKEAGIVRPGEGRPLNVMGHKISVKLDSKETGGDYYVFEVATPAGAGIPPHVHQNEDEVIYIIEGTYEIFLNGRTFIATAGSVLNFARYAPHGFTNVGSSTGRTVWVVTPGIGFEQFFEELGALPADQPPDLGKVAQIFGSYGMEILPPPEHQM